jgi:hypothetical protein
MKFAYRAMREIKIKNIQLSNRFAVIWMIGPLPAGRRSRGK